MFALSHSHKQLLVNYSSTYTTSNYLASTTGPERMWKKNANKLYLILYAKSYLGQKTCFISGVLQMLYKHSPPSFQEYRKEVLLHLTSDSKL